MYTCAASSSARLIPPSCSNMVPTGLSPGTFFLTGYIFFSPITRIALLVLIVTTCGSALCAWLPAYKSLDCFRVWTVPVIRHRKNLCIPRHPAAVTLSTLQITVSAFRTGNKLSLLHRNRQRVLHLRDKYPPTRKHHTCAVMSH